MDRRLQILALFGALLLSCSEPTCPDGQILVGTLCRTVRSTDSGAGGSTGAWLDGGDEPDGSALRTPIDAKVVGPDGGSQSNCGAACGDSCSTNSCTTAGTSCAAEPSGTEVHVCSLAPTGCFSLEVQPCDFSCWDDKQCTTLNRYYWPENETVVVRSVAFDTAGNLFATGSATTPIGGMPSNGARDALLSKWNADGKLLWSKTWGTASDDVMYGLALSETSAQLAIAGTVNGHIWVAVLDPENAGATIWERTDLPSGAAEAIIYGPDGAIFIAGYVSGQPRFAGQTSIGGTDAFLLRLDPAAGYTAWARQFGKPSETYEPNVQADFHYATQLASNSSNLYVVGAYNMLSAGSLGGGDAFLTMFSSSGVQAWDITIDYGGGEIAKAVAVDELGNATVAGLSYPLDATTNPSISNYFLAKYSSEGAQQWSKHDQLTTQVDTLVFDTSHQLWALDDAGFIVRLSDDDGSWQTALARIGPPVPSFNDGDMVEPFGGGLALFESGGQVTRAATSGGDLTTKFIAIAGHK